MSKIERIVQKLRRDGPWQVGQRVLHRQWRRVQNRRRRRRWQGADVADAAEAIPPGFSPEGAESLWPGAADRRWVDEAKTRWPELYNRACQQAADAAEGRFDLLGSGPVDVLDDRGRIRWHDDFKAGVSFPSEGLYLDVPIFFEEEGSDIKVPWELSRFGHVFAFLWTDPQRYGDVFLGQWRSWLQANPPARGVNWACTMDVALRAITWTAALAAWGREWDRSTLEEFAASLATAGRFVRDNLEWVPGVRTNHYFTDIVALAVLGAVLPPYPEARLWSTFAARELRREILQQFAPDGFNKECSTTYHRLMVELATLGALACRFAGEDLGEDCRARITEAYRAVDACMDARGTMPLIGDNDSSRLFHLAPRGDEEIGYLLPIGATVFEADDLAIGEAPPELALLCGPGALGSYRPQSSAANTVKGRALRDGGLFVLGDGRDRLTVRCGPSTYRPVGGHRHLDQLSISVTACGEPIIIDPGQYCYTPWPVRRNHYRSTASHNTVEVDGQLQCRVFTGGRTLYSIIDEATPRCDTFEVDARGGRFAGHHSGYRRLSGGADHERLVDYVAGDRCWTVEDRLALRGEHTCIWRFHLHPEARVEIRAQTWYIQRGGARLALRCFDDPPPTGAVEADTCAPAYGRELPAQMLVFKKHGVGPVQTRFELRVHWERE